jgi:hypothetical protein
MYPGHYSVKNDGKKVLWDGHLIDVVLNELSNLQKITESVLSVSFYNHRYQMKIN